MFIQGSLKHSQVGKLEQEAWLGSLEARHTASFLAAVPESNNSHSRNTQYIDIFLTRYLNVLNTPNIHCTPRVLHYVAAHIYENNDDGALGIESAPREFTKLHLSLMGNVTIYYYTPSHGRVD